MWVFFLDENLQGNIFKEALEGAGVRVELHRDHFAPGILDELWIASVAARGWIILTGDIKTRLNPIEAQAIINSKARVIHVKKGKNVGHPELARNFVNSLGVVLNFIEKHEPPFVGTLSRPSKQEDYFKGKPGSITLKLK